MPKKLIPVGIACIGIPMLMVSAAYLFRSLFSCEGGDGVGSQINCNFAAGEYIVAYLLMGSMFIGMFTFIPGLLMLVVGLVKKFQQP